jgi:Ca-activated chloride channel family protein
LRVPAQPPRWRPLLALSLVVLFAATAPAHADRKTKREEEAKIAALPAKYQQFLAEVEILISPSERTAYLALEEDYQRDAFIENFWRSRDPYPDTSRNELRDQWEARLEQAAAEFGSLQDERSRMLLFNGPPTARIVVSCLRTWPAEVWFYDKSNRTREELFIIFTQRFGVGDYVIWYPSSGAADLLRDAPVGAPSGRGGDMNLLAQVRNDCSGPTGEALFAALSSIYRAGFMGYPLLLMRAQAPLEKPSAEWLATFASYSTEVPLGAATFPAELGFAFPGRRQTRTMAQATVKVAVADLGSAELGGARSYNVLVTGEVLSGDELFDRFRYKFDFPASEVPGTHLPLVFQRPLRPGTYRLLLKIEDLNGKRFFRSDGQLVVPAVEAMLPPPPPSDPETALLLAEANALLAAGETGVKLLRPVGRDMLAGKVRFDALVTGDNVAGVTFALDGQPILSKRAPPWSVELDLGHLPRSQVLRATAVDAAGEELADDELVLNASSHRFAVRITHPLRAQRFAQSVRLAAEVELPEGEPLDRVEMFRDETLVATVYQPPYEQPILLPGGSELTYLRVVAYTADGNSTEDHVFINAPPGLEEIDVQLVELYTSVVDRNSRPAEGLAEADFTIIEDGVTQTPVRFERVRDLPIRAGLVVDTSASMVESLEEAQRAALSFFTETIGPKDRAALITFNDRPQLVVKLTNELLELGGGLAGLKAERGTALYDSVVFALYYFNGIRGQRALVVLSDGKDESSRFDFDQTLDFARRAGVTLYTVGLAIERGEGDARRALVRLAEETGGRAFFVDTASELTPIYQAIEEELRSQYLLVYQSTNTGTDKKFRTVEVKVREPGLDAHTIRGYYP